MWRYGILRCCSSAARSHFGTLHAKLVYRESRLWHAAYGNFAVLSPRSDADALMCWRCLSDVAAFELTNITKKSSSWHGIQIWLVKWRRTPVGFPHHTRLVSP